jgi:hypothetical protein
MKEPTRKGKMNTEAICDGAIGKAEKKIGRSTGRIG